MAACCEGCSSLSLAPVRTHCKFSNHGFLCQKHTSSRTLAGSWWEQICFCCFSSGFGNSALPSSLWRVQQQLVWTQLWQLGDSSAVSASEWSSEPTNCLPLQSGFFDVFKFNLFFYYLKETHAGTISPLLWLKWDYLNLQSKSLSSPKCNTGNLAIHAELKEHCPCPKSFMKKTDFSIFRKLCWRRTELYRWGGS